MKVLFFGISKEIVGQRELSDLVIDSGETVESLITRLKLEYPDLSKISSLAVSVNQRYAKNETMIKKNDIVALIPPVSGG